MQKIRGNKWNRRICKWIASLLTVALLVNQSSLSVLAEEIGEAVCQCDTRCSADSVNAGCPVCAQDYGRCEGAEDVTDTDTGEETENPGEGEGVDTGTGEETENPDAGTDPDTDEETEDSDAGEDEDVNTDVDTEDVSDMDAEDEEDALLQEEVARNVAEGDAVSRTPAPGFFDDNGFRYKIINEDENNLQVEFSRRVDGALTSEEWEFPSTASDGTNVYKVVRIGDYACSYWGVKSITIPDSITSTGEYAFWRCDKLTSITFPDSFTSIGPKAFDGCSSLTSVTIPDSVTSIGNAAFWECSNLTSINIPDGITSIEWGTFTYCKKLENITIPDSVTSIGRSAFLECYSLTNITIPDKVTSIEDDAFYYCSGLTNITIPASVTSIGASAFAACGKLESVKILNDRISLADRAFYADPKLNSLQIVLTDNNTVNPPTVANIFCFVGCRADRSLTFLTKDGIEVSDTTTPKLAEATKAYVTADGADGLGEGLWYGWKIPGDLPVSGHSVTINVNKDDSPWGDRQSEFALSSDNGRTFITDLNDVSNGTYIIYDTTGAEDSAAYVKTDVQVKVSYTDADAEVNYYTVTFYNDNDLVGEPQTVLKNKKVSEPSPSPVKDGYTLSWVTYNADGSSTEFDINNPITAKTDIYASWIKEEEKTFTITASAGDGGSVSPSGAVTVKSGDDQQFTITPDDGYRISSVLVDDVEQLSSTQALDHSRAGISDAENNAKSYTFENVTDNHTLTASFAAISTGGDIGGGGSDDNGDDDDPDDNNGGGGSGGGGSTGGGGSGGGGGSDTGGGSDGSGGGDTEGGGSDGGDANDNGGSDNSGGDSTGGSNSPASFGNGARATVSDTSVKNGVSVNNVRSTAPASKDSEPKTGDASHMEIYATIAMIAGLSYILLYFADGKNGMTEEEKKEIVAALVAWAKNGSRVKKYAALAVIFLILVYYHSIGKRTTVDWKEVYEK